MHNPSIDQRLDLKEDIDCHTTNLCVFLGLTEHISYFVHKIIERGKRRGAFIRLIHVSVPRDEIDSNDPRKRRIMIEIINSLPDAVCVCVVQKISFATTSE